MYNMWRIIRKLCLITLLFLSLPKCSLDELAVRKLLSVVVSKLTFMSRYSL